MAELHRNIEGLKEQSEVILDEIVKVKDKEIAELKVENIELKQENQAMEKALNWLGKTKEWALKGYSKLLDIFSPQREEQPQQVQEHPKEYNNEIYEDMMSSFRQGYKDDRTEEITEKASNILKNR